MSEDITKSYTCVPAGRYVLSDIQKGSDGVPYWKGYNAYLPITVT